jgi:hypothetical protein
VPRVRVQSSATYSQYRALAQRLRGADKELQRNLRRRIRQEGQPVLSAVRAAAAGIEMTSPGGSAGGSGRSTGLRARLAAATKLSVTASGISFQVQESKVDPRYGDVLTAGSEGHTWRHPVFGNRNAWVTQHGTPWFYPTVRAAQPAFRRAVEQAMRDTMDMIES